jgi:hypothetical protein
MTKRLRFGRHGLVAVVVVICVVAAGSANAGHQDSSVTSYTGCLNTSGDSAGNVLKIKAGNSPLKPCGSGQTEFHFSGGDISAVRTPTGSGLTGGSENGAVTLDIAEKFRLPQGCGVDKIAIYDGAERWVCGTDANTTYTVGTGLDLAGTAFSVEPGYRLPQSCGNGQVAKSDGSGAWNCASDNDTGLPTVYIASGQNISMSNFTEYVIASKQVPAGRYLISYAGELLNGDDDPQSGYCELSPAPADHTVHVRMFPIDGGTLSSASIALLDTAEFGGTTTIEVRCATFSGRAFGTVTALRVGAIS